MYGVQCDLGAVVGQRSGAGWCSLSIEDSLPEGVLEDPSLSCAVSLWFAGDDSALAALPVIWSGTPFQVAVWQALRGIGWGQTVSYGELARALGKPASAARAVGGAVAANPLALAVPCHRVLPAGGGVGGFRWGAARKARLLALERSEPQVTLGFC